MSARIGSAAMRGQVEEVDPAQATLDKLQESMQEYMTLEQACYLGNQKEVAALCEQASEIEINTKHEATKNTCLIDASRQGHLGVVKLLIASSAKPDVPGFGGLTALHHATMQEQLHVIAFLVNEAKANVNVQDEAGNTCVHYAARSGSLKSFELFAQHEGTDMKLVNEKKTTILMQATLNAQFALVETILKSGVDVNGCDTDGNTALHIGCKLGYSQIVKRLLVGGARQDLRNRDGHTAADVAGSEAISALLSSTKV